MAQKIKRNSTNKVKEREISKAEYLSIILKKCNQQYENYFVNKIWNGVEKCGIIPVTQQVVKCESGKYYYLDLYFPQIKLAVEIDEKHHLSNIDNDQIREKYIESVLTSKGKVVNNKLEELTRVETNDFKGFRRIAIFESNGDKTEYESLLKAVKKVVDEINKEFKKLKFNKTTIAKEWQKFLDPFAFVKNQNNVVFVKDNLQFKTMPELSKQNGGFINYITNPFPGGFNLKDNDEFYLWFPNTIFKDKNNNSQWGNNLSQDYGEITEVYLGNNNKKLTKNEHHLNKKRIVFAKMKDSATKKTIYKFIGIYAFAEYKKGPSSVSWVYKRIGLGFDFDNYKIIEK